MNIPTFIRTLAVAALVATGPSVGAAQAAQPASDPQPTVVTAGQTRISTDKMTYVVGEPITIRYTLPAKGYIRILDYQGTKVSTLRTGYRNSAEGTIQGTVSPPAGKECLTLEYSSRPLPATPPDRAALKQAPNGSPGQSPAFAETCFEVLEKKPDTPTPTPTPAPPTISGLTAQAVGTYAVVSFTTAEPAYVTFTHNPVTTPAAAQQATAQVFDGQFQATTSSTGMTQSPAQIFDGQFHATFTYATTHELKLTGLTSNTTYDMTVTATTQSGQKHTAKTSFTTLKKRVRVILQSIDIQDDGELIGDGEPRWNVTPTWDGDSFVNPNSGRANSFCYPHEGSEARCKYGKFGEGRITPRNPNGKALMFVFAEEDFDRFPSTITLGAWAKEDDHIPDLGCYFTGEIVDSDKVEWRVPQGVEGAYQILTVRGDDSCEGFKSVLTFSVELLHNNAT